MPRKQVKRRGRPSAIAKLTTAQLMGEIERRRGMVGQLTARRDDIAGQLEAIDAEIAAIESIGATTNGQAARRGRGRPKGSGKGGAGRGRGGNEQSLASVLQSVLRGKTMSVPEMAGAATKAGYKSKSKNFRTVVGLTLLKNPKMFKRVSRGQYTAK